MLRQTSPVFEAAFTSRRIPMIRSSLTSTASSPSPKVTDSNHFLEGAQGLRSGAPAFRPCARQWGWCRPETRERAGNRDLRKGHKSAIPSEDTLQIQDDEFHPKWNYPPVIG